MTRKVWRSGRGTLGIVAFLLIGSAIARVGTDAGAAFASGVKAMSAPSAVEDAVPAGPAPDALLAALQERESRLDQREAQLADRMKALSVAEEEIDRKIKEMQAAEAALRDMIAMAETAAESDIAGLIKVYEAMKPADAAALFETMEPEFAAGFLGRMQPEFAAGILSGLTPQMAYSISAILAGRNVKVPTE